MFVQWILGIDVPDTTSIGRNFNMFHGSGLVINSNAIIGENVIVRHNTTIGTARNNGGSPRIGNNVNIGANSVIIGDIKIGNYSIIAAGSVVIRDVPENVIVAGNPASVVKNLKLYETI
ncbi:serine O-acetyltransferase [Spirosoma aerophilum]